MGKEANVRFLIIIGDSSMVIKVMLGKTTPLDSRFEMTIAQAKTKASAYPKISFFHVKHILSWELEKMRGSHFVLSPNVFKAWQGTSNTHLFSHEFSPIISNTSHWNGTCKDCSLSLQHASSFICFVY